MAEENQVMKELQGKAAQMQQVMKEPQRVTTKDPKKVEAGKRLAAISCKKREVKKREEQAQLVSIGVNQYYGIGAVYSSGSDRWPWLLHLSVQERPPQPENS